MIESTKRSNNDFDCSQKSSKRSRTQTNRYGNTEKEKTYVKFLESDSDKSMESLSIRDAELAENGVTINNLSIDFEEIPNGQVIENLTSGRTSEPGISAIPSADTISIEEILPKIEKMSGIIAYLTEKMNGFSSELRQLRNSPSLQINEDTNDEDSSQSKQFEAFDLPITDQNQLERLENCLKVDRTFNVFFVSIRKISFNPNVQKYHLMNFRPDK